MKRIAYAFLFILVTVSAPAFAGNADIQAAQTVIDSQIKAFLANDDQTAYSYASPRLQEIFPTVGAFMNMVERAYQPVWRPRSYAFGDAKEPAPGSVVQHVMVVGPDGKDYEAVYTLEKQPDGRFLITSVSLKATGAVST
ncbi:MAG: DUF4864 domain-containing protein [Rhizobiaceae bacterium]